MVKAVGGMKAMKALKSGMKGAKPVIKKKEDENKDDEKKKKVKPSVNALEVLKTPAQTQSKVVPMKVQKRPARVTRTVAEVVDVPPEGKKKRGRPPAKNVAPPSRWNSSLEGYGPTTLIEIALGDLIEVTDMDEQGFSRGNYAIKVTELQPVSSRGRFVKGKFCGGDRKEVEEAFQSVNPNKEEMLFHICVRPDKCDVSPPSGVPCWHIELWRIRNADACSDLGWLRLDWKAPSSGNLAMIEDGPRDEVMDRVNALRKKFESIRGKAAEASGQSSGAKRVGQGTLDEKGCEKEVTKKRSTPQKDELLRQLDEMQRALKKEEGLMNERSESAQPPEKCSPAAMLAKRAAERKEARSRSRGRKRSRSRKKRRKRRSSSASESGSSDFHSSRHTGMDKSLQSRAKRAPGRLVKSMISKMKDYLGNMQGDQSIPELAPITTAYLTSVLMPSRTGQVSKRNSGELRTLAKCIDHLMTGNVAEAADILAQRFQAVETADQEGSWNMAKHLEIVTEARVTAVPEEDKRRAIRLEKSEAKYRKDSANLMRRPDGG